MRKNKRLERLCCCQTRFLNQKRQFLPSKIPGKTRCGAEIRLARICGTNYFKDMKIEGPGGVRYTGKVGGPKKSGSVDKSAFADVMGADETAEAAPTTQTTQVMSVDQLIGLQGVDDAMHGKKQAQQRANDILDRLDALRLQILEGRISKEQLLQLARVINAKRAHTTDPYMIEILNEIELRAQIEIAKFTRDATPSNS